jgi:murein DD-endopeptidase MepM/ murein hydrolase activator NlpD
MLWLFVLLAGFLLVLPGSPVSGQAEGPLYVVQEGDTLSAIAQKFGVSLEALIEANAIANPAALFPGTELVIPGFEDVSGALVTTEIAYGDSLSSLSFQYGIAADDLARLNKLVHPERLYAGQPLIVPEQGSQPAWESASAALIETGQGLLETTSAQGANTWGWKPMIGDADRLWVVPGETMLLQESEGGFNPIPALIQNLQVSPYDVVQGQTLTLSLDLAAAAWVEGDLDGRPLNVVSAGGGQYLALQGIHALAQPGLVELEIRLYADQGRAQSYAFRQPLRVIEGNYFSEALVVPPQTLDPKNTEPEDQLIADVVAQVSPDRLWEGVFQFPTTYYEQFPSFFGNRRSYNGSPYSYYHTGLDLYGSSSTPVFAPARGRIALTAELTVRGNVTYIDHGWGLYSGYLHQSQILVEEGQIVEAGELVGYVGGTGRVTGPHLHWEIWVGGIPVDPLEWTAQAFP